MFNSKSFGSTLLKLLAGILLVYLIIFVGSLTRNNLKKFYYIGKAERLQNTIVITGDGKVIGTPDIAVVEVGFLTEKPDVASAQKENTEKMNKLLAEIKKLGVKEDDMQTSQYQIYPKYDYTEGKTVLAGYTVNQNVSLKIRDLTKVSQVLAKVGEVGVNQVSGLSFTIDKPENLQAEARAKALVDARAKAEALTQSLGVKIVRVVSFSEYNQPASGPLYLKSAPIAEGIGGGAVPEIQSGSLEVKVGVNVVYEIE